MSANPKTKKGARRADGVMSPEELAKAIEAYKNRRAQRMAAKADEEGDVKPADVPASAPAAEVKPASDGDDTVIAASGKEDGDDTAAKVQMVKDRRDRRDQEGDPKTLDEANGVIATRMTIWRSCSTSSTPCSPRRTSTALPWTAPSATARTATRTTRALLPPPPCLPRPRKTRMTSRAAHGGEHRRRRR